MLTNEKRREIATRLRNLASHKAADEEMTLDALGLYRGENIEGYDTYGVMQLADLIEPEPERTCGLRSRLTGSYCYECSECGKGMKPEWEYCQHCGAKVMRNE